MIHLVAWRNLWRRRQRTLFTALAMGVGVGLSMGTMALQRGVSLELFDELVTDTLGHVQLHHPQYPSTRRLHDTLKELSALTAQVEGQRGVLSASPRLMSVALVGGAQRSTGALITGVDPVREAQLSELDQSVTKGAWLPPQPERLAVIGEGLAEELSISVGGELAVVGQDAYGGVAQGLFKVSGVVRSGSVELDSAGVWLHLQDAQALFVLEDQAHELIIVSGDRSTQVVGEGEDERALQTLKAELIELPLLQHERPLTRTWREAMPSVSQLMDTQRASSYIMLVIVLALAALGILNTMLMSVYERTRELGVLLAIGVRPRSISALVIIEALYLATAAALIGLSLGGAIDYLLVTYGLDFSVNGQGLSYGGVRLSPRLYGAFEWEATLVTLAALYLTTLLASLWPAYRAAHLEPVEAINRGAQ